jgi:hypothetical protein
MGELAGIFEFTLVLAQVDTCTNGVQALMDCRALTFQPTWDASPPCGFDGDVCSCHISETGDPEYVFVCSEEACTCYLPNGHYATCQPSPVPCGWKDSCCLTVLLAAGLR